MMSSGFWSRSRKSFIFEYVRFCIRGSWLCVYVSRVYRFLHSVIINFSNFLKKLPRPACIDGRACMASPKLFSSITRSGHMRSPVISFFKKLLRVTPERCRKTLFAAFVPQF